MQKVKWLLVGFAALVMAPATAILATGSARAGELNCGEALVCILTCDAGDAQCAYDCGQNLHFQAEELYAELMMCLVPVCPGSPPDALCLMQAAAGPCEAEHKACVNNSECTPTCEGKECGSDGCGGQCGSCPPGMGCNEGFECIACEPECGGKTCGDDGCGGSCGECGAGQGCIDFQCIECTPDCIGKECGEDGCGGQCGQCGFGADCVNGMCISCTPNCAGKECGDNGCGGMCGACPPDYKCDGGVCIEDIPCNPNCLNRECGDDGCGGDCGTCGDGQHCSGSGICVSGDEPEVTEQPGEVSTDKDVGEEPRSGDAGPGGKDTGGGGTVEPVNGQCPEGYKYWFGKCEKEEEEGGGGGGCSAAPASSGPSILLLLLLLISLARVRRIV